MEIAFKELYCKNFNRLKNFANVYLRSEEVAVCIIQDIFTHVYENRERFPLDDSLLPYLFVMVKHRCINYLKRERAKQRYCNDSLYQFNIDIALESLNCYSIESFDYKRLVKLYRKALEAMPTSVRDTFLLSRNDNYKYREIAEIQNISIKTVEYRMMQAIKVLKEYLKGYYAIMLYLLLG
ncbi:MAG: RNA polymerase sigma-70 factor [Bacteroidales bacterium]|nr:RNA polymerase sigma-70 factor [Bacteroidales bacterium]MBQ6871082.1 RNA polymerase sigma-70 factor [Bacteroidales bacterium]